jgi:FkbM family methyltransferase
MSPVMPATLRRLGAHPRVEPYVAAALRARAMRPSLPYFVGQLRGRGEGDYVVRANGVPVHVVHGSSDAAAVDQAFLSDAYEPSPAAAAALAALGRPPRILDLGANIGMFSLWASRRWPGAHLTAVEPLPRNVAALTRNLQAALPTGTYEVVAAAATTHDGELTFGGSDDFSQGHIVSGGDGITVAARDVFALADDVDLLKIDIEGAEWPVAADSRFAALRVPVVMFEYHPDGAPAGATPEESADALLRGAGYAIERTVIEYPGAGVVWGVRVV